MIARRVGPNLNDQTSGAIAAAAFAEWAAVGYGRLTIDNVARRAGVGKAAIYRRWPSKEAMIVALVATVGIDAAPAVDTGSLEGDVLALLQTAQQQLSHPLVARIVPDLLAETARDATFARTIYTEVGVARRDRAAEVLDRAIRRDELAPDIDYALALDFIGAPLYWRLAVTREPLSGHALEQMARAVASAIAAASG